MDVMLPNGKEITGVPEGTPKDMIMQKAIAAGLATASDFGAQPPDQEVDPQAQLDAMNDAQSGQFVPEIEKQDVGLADRAIGAGETALALATGATTGMVGSIYGTLTQLAKEIRQGNYGSHEAADRIEAEMQKQMGNFSYAPKTEVGQEYTQSVGEALEPMAGLTPMTAEIAGAMTAATMAPKGIPPKRMAPKPVIDREMGSDFTPEPIPAEVVPGARNADEIASAAMAGGKVRDFVMNPKSPDFAEVVLRNGELVTDPIARQAVNQGLDKGLVSMVKTSSLATRSKYAAMMNIIKKGKDDLRYQDANRVWDVAGDSMELRISHLVDINKEAGREVSQAAKNLAGQSVDYAPAMGSFIDDLGEHGVMFSRNADGRLVPEFGQSTFRASAKPKRMIKVLVDMLDTDGPVDAKKGHIAKKVVDELVNWGKESSGSAGQVEVSAKRLRGSINELLGEVSPEYKAANTKYAETIGVLDDFAKASGSKLNPGDDGYYQAIGTGLRRMLSNATSKSALIKSANDIETIAAKYGAKFPDDVRDQVSFANHLDGLFGPAAKTSLAGETAKVFDKVAETATGQQTMTGLVTSGLKSGYKFAKGRNEANAIKALEELVRTNYVTP